MSEYKCITLEELKEHEAEEYKTLQDLNRIHADVDKQYNYKKVLSLENSITYQRARWGMLMDLIEELENNNE